MSQHLIYRSRESLHHDSLYPAKRDEIIEAMGTRDYIWYWFYPNQENIYISETGDIFPTSVDIVSNIWHMSYDYEKRKFRVRYNNSFMAVPYKTSKVFNVLKSIRAFEEFDV